MNKTTLRTLFSILAGAALLAGCGSSAPAPGDPGSGGGGGSSPGAKPSGGEAAAAKKPVAKVKRCITKNKAKVASGKGDLLAAEAAVEVLVVTYASGNKANVAFFADEDASQDANSSARNGKLSFRDGKVVPPTPRRRPTPTATPSRTACRTRTRIRRSRTRRPSSGLAASWTAARARAAPPAPGAPRSRAVEPSRLTHPCEWPM